ncbi:hypothetical protein MF6394_13745 [Pseudomonas sp. MF6394]|uniref:Uncharacterized protein n=1 Tax=Pseudomonas fluorescens TaxID=294 RepID=A0A2T0HRQ9_PSEFL|nr:hypothetical protein BFC21_04470 [Pseudomonas sp. TMW 2.1634]OOW02179.1 hypothetical protein MF6394_13745 [Pseudomonas sp. MF6394]PRW85780.1 hypothetical protein C7A10_26240 [Pseudomonas fluorescens]
MSEYLIFLYFIQMTHNPHTKSTPTERYQCTISQAGGSFALGSSSILPRYKYGRTLVKTLFVESANTRK